MGALRFDRSFAPAAVGESVLFQNQGAGGGRENSAPQRDPVSAAGRAVDSDQPADVQGGDHLGSHRASADEEARRGIVRERVAQAGVSVVGDGAQGGKDELPRQCGRAILAHAVGQDERDFPAAHFDLVLVRLPALHIPGDAAVGVDLPPRGQGLRLRREAADKDEDEFH